MIPSPYERQRRHFLLPADERDALGRDGLGSRLDHADPSQTWTGSDFPFAAMGSASRYSIASRVASYVKAPTRIPFTGAADWSRAAVFITSPDAMPSPSLAFRAHDDARLARVHADADLQVKPFVLGVQVLDRVPNGQRSTDCPLRVVFVSGGRPEQGDDGIADELLDRAAVPLELGAQPRVVGGEPRTHVLGIHLLGLGRRADDVREEDGDELPLLGRGHGSRSLERRAAREAELCDVRILLAACGADLHKLGVLPRAQVASTRVLPHLERVSRRMVSAIRCRKPGP